MLSQLLCSHCAFRMAGYSAFLYIFHACLTLDVSRCFSRHFSLFSFYGLCSWYFIYASSSTRIWNAAQMEEGGRVEGEGRLANKPQTMIPFTFWNESSVASSSLFMYDVVCGLPLLWGHSQAVSILKSKRVKDCQSFCSMEMPRVANFHHPAHRPLHP